MKRYKNVPKIRLERILGIFCHFFGHLQADNQSIVKFFVDVKTGRWVSLGEAWQLVRVDVQIPSGHLLSWIEPQIFQVVIYA